MTRLDLTSSLLGLLLVGLAAGGAAGCDGESDPEAVTGDEANEEAGPAAVLDSYEVLFTNPVCRRYDYAADQVVTTAAGERLLSKPENVYCTRADAAASGARAESPQNKLITWIDDPSTEEVFLAYFSMSNAPVTEALCRAIEERDVKVTIVLDQGSDRARAEQVMACAPKSGDPERAPQLLLRGGEGNIALQHDKIFILDPHGTNPRIVFSSGNMSSGTVLHHENWHFVQLPAETHFAQAHGCLIQGLTDHTTSKTEFSSFMKSCRAAIEAKEERDLKVFFIPGEGDRAFQFMQKGLKAAERIDVAAHRFTYKGLVSNLKKRLDAGGAEVRLVVDDDLWWAGKGDQVGGNDMNEWNIVSDLTGRGLDVGYMQTNHGEGLLHHNKFIVMDMPDGQADVVFAGSGNFTGSAFSGNLENFYWTTIPAIVERFHAQYEHLHGELASAAADLPTTNVLPPSSP